MFKLNLTENILNKFVFERMSSFTVNQDVGKIENQVFKSFKYLRKITFHLFSLKMFFNRGTKWLEFLNYQSDIEMVDHNQTSNGSVLNSTQLLVRFKQFLNRAIHLNVETYAYPDEDFCLFAQFPHEKNVFPVLDKCFNSCTFYWLIQYKSSFDLTDYIFDCKINYFKIHECNFSKMIQNCLLDKQENEETIINSNILYYMYDQYYVLKRLDLLLSIYIFPTVCLTGCLLNILNILTLKNIIFSKLFKKRMYQQMLFNSILNVIICTVYLFRLTIKCIDPIGSFCIESLLTLKFFRYSVLILTNYFGNVLKTFANLIHISIALDRYILSSNTHSRFFKRFHDLSLRKIFSIQLLFSCLMNINNIFEYKFDLSYSNFAYPAIYAEFFNLKRFYGSFNLLSIFLSQFFVFFFQTLIDLYLMTFIQKTIRLSNQNVILFLSNSKYSSYEKSKRNIKLMIIISGLLLLIFHSPDMLISIYMGIFFKKIYGNYFNYFELLSHMLINIAEIIYFMNYSFNFMLYYYFNRNFRLSFKNLFFRLLLNRPVS